MDEATLFEEADDGVDVIAAAGCSGFDEAAGGEDAQPLDVEDGGGLEFGGKRLRRQGVGFFVAIGGLPRRRRRGGEDGFGAPADRLRLLSPNGARLVLGFAEASGGARLVEELLLAFEAEFVPVHGVADHLAVALGEGRDRARRDVEAYSWTLWAVRTFESIEPILPSSVTTRFGMKLCK